MATRGSRRLSVNLAGRAAAAMDEAMEIAGLLQTDIVGRALLSYNNMLKAVQDGSVIIVRAKDGTEREVWFL